LQSLSCFFHWVSRVASFSAKLAAELAPNCRARKRMNVFPSRRCPVNFFEENARQSEQRIWTCHFQLITPACTCACWTSDQKMRSCSDTRTRQSISGIYQTAASVPSRCGCTRPSHQSRVAETCNFPTWQTPWGH
jgi:hypothetical protein